ncbi:MAG: SEC-C metal-binding domain-containing protein, partial [Candidatus Tectomicrobia bacterium]|nr:SEC-C metal-binding domain-containing protein [Candidatus Tectomicrobia bacterium]
MKVGRNAPCPCGSGKKYKKCCLAIDEQERQASVAVVEPEPAPAPPAPRPAAPPPAPPSPPDPRMEAINARWEAFEEQDYEGRIALFTETLDDAELMDDEMAFEMLNTLYSPTIEHDERDRFDALVEALRTRLPEVYEESAHFHLQWLISNALAARRFDALPSLVKELVTTAKHDIDAFNHVIDALAYHGQLHLIVEAMRLAWPWVQEPGNVVPWGISEFSTQAVYFVLLEYSLQHAMSDPEDPTLAEQLNYYGEYDPEGVRRFLVHLTNQAERSWTMDDFTFQRRQPPRRARFDDFDDDDEDESQPVPVDPARQNLFDLSVEFVGYLYREEDVPLTKGELARQQLIEYILQRFEGKLELQESRLNSARRSKQRRQKSKQRRLDHVLCPDRRTFDRFLAERMSFMNPQWYKTSVT